jgi:hypothetical protein
MHSAISRNEIINLIQTYGIPKYVKKWISNPAYSIEEIIYNYHKHTHLISTVDEGESFKKVEINKQGILKLDSSQLLVSSFENIGENLIIDLRDNSGEIVIYLLPHYIHYLVI